VLPGYPVLTDELLDYREHALLGTDRNRLFDQDGRACQQSTRSILKAVIADQDTHELIIPRRVSCRAQIYRTIADPLWISAPRKLTKVAPGDSSRRLRPSARTRP
jgi:hypothetical protein